MGRVSPRIVWSIEGHESVSRGTSLVAQWLRIRLPMQGTRVWALVQEDPTCRGASKPVCHNYWAWALESVSHNYWACVPQLLKPAHLEPVPQQEKPQQWDARAPQWRVAPRSLQLEKARVQQRRPNAAKKKKKKIKGTPQFWAKKWEKDTKNSVRTLGSETELSLQKQTLDNAIKTTNT